MEQDTKRAITQPLILQKIGIQVITKRAFHKFRKEGNTQRDSFPRVLQSTFYPLLTAHSKEWGTMLANYDLMLQIVWLQRETPQPFI